MKRHVIFVLAVILFLLVPIGALANEKPIEIVIDGQKIISDVPPTIQDGRVLVPVRIISENLGFKVSWNTSINEVFITNGETELRLLINQPILWKNGEIIDIDVPPVIKNGRTLVPIRALSENFGATVTWDSSTRTVFIEAKTIQNSDHTEDTEETIIESKKTSFQITSQVEIKDPVLTLVEEPQNQLIIDFINVFPHQLTFPVITDDSLIEGIEVNQEQVINTRVVVALKEKVNYSFVTEGSTITFDLEGIVQSVEVGPTKKVIVIDAGHGGRDPGATSITGKLEKDLNLAVALKVASLLQWESNMKVVMTRSTDDYILLHDRVGLANDLGADLFVSIHGNAMPSKSYVSGVETYYTRPDSLEFARVMHKRLLEATNFPDRGIKTADFIVTKYTQMPAVLLELGYLTNAGDEKLLYNDEFQLKVAKAIVQGIKEYIAE